MDYLEMFVWVSVWVSVCSVYKWECVLWCMCIKGTNGTMLKPTMKVWSHYGTASLLHLATTSTETNLKVSHRMFKKEKASQSVSPVRDPSTELYLLQGVDGCQGNCRIVHPRYYKQLNQPNV